MPQNRTMDWLLVVVPGFLSIKFFLEKDMIYGVVWGIVCVLYLIHALKLLKKDKEAAKYYNTAEPADEAEHKESVEENKTIQISESSDE